MKKRNLELYRKIPSSTNLLNYPRTTYALYKEVDKKDTGCNLKTTELLDCALIGVCVVIRSNMVCTHITDEDVDLLAP